MRMCRLRYVWTLAGALCVAGAAWAAPLIADDDLVVYYSFDTVNTVVADESGHGNDATVVNTVSADANGMRGGAALFAYDTTADPDVVGYLDMDGANFPAADIPTDGFTLAVWCRPSDTDDINAHAIFNARAGDNTFLIHPEIRDADFRITLRGAGSTMIKNFNTAALSPAIAPVWDEWVHYVVTYDTTSGLVTLYLDGEPVFQEAADNVVPLPDNWDQGARVGYNTDDARPFSGLMDEFYIFKRALTPAEVQQLFELNDPNADDDGDGLTNQEEADLGTNPNDADSDNDGLDDGEEVNTYGTLPLNADSDGDGATDGFEIAEGFDPLDPESTPELPAVPLGPMATALGLVALLAAGGLVLFRLRRAQTA